MYNDIVVAENADHSELYSAVSLYTRPGDRQFHELPESVITTEAISRRLSKCSCTMCDTIGAIPNMRRTAHIAITPQKAIMSVHDDRHIEPLYSLTTLVSWNKLYSSCSVATTPPFKVTARMSKTTLSSLPLESSCNP
jgi:hypothetical protein